MNTPNTAGYKLPVLNATPSVIPDVARKESPFAEDYWLSVSEKLRSDEHADPIFEGEFPPGATELDAVGRRSFVKLLGASMALAGVGTACSSPNREKLVPYHRNPEGLTIGNPLHYATAVVANGVATSVLVKAREGRPIKVEGNPDHPLVNGAAGSAEFAELLAMYDPHRAKQIKNGPKTVSKKEYLDIVKAKIASLNQRNGGASLRFLVEPTSSGLHVDLHKQILAQLPNAKVIATSALSQQARHEGAFIAFGKALQPVFAFEKAKVVVSLDEDFLFAWGANLASAAGWAKGRTPGADMSRLYVVEPTMTVTGTMADHRLRVKGSQVEGVARALAAKLGGGLSAIAGGVARNEALVNAMAEDLKAAGSSALIVVGERQPPIVHALAYAMNAQLGSVGNTMSFVAPPVSDTVTGPGTLSALVAEIQAGQVDTVIITANNPIYMGYADVDFAGALAKVESHYWGLFEDETAAKATYFVNAAHALESWGELKALDGSTLIQQPLIEPLYNGVSDSQFFAMWAGLGETKGLPLLKESLKKRTQMSDADFDSWLWKGFIPQSTAKAEAVTVDVSRLTTIGAMGEIAGLEVNLVRDYKVHDGRLAHVSWLQELPDPVSKLVWDNAILLSPKTAEGLGLKMRSLNAAPAREYEKLKITVNGKSVEAPYYIMPGHADDCLTLSLGYGQKGAVEKLAKEVIGANAYGIRFMSAPWFAAAKLEKTGQMHPLTTTQEHWDMNERKIALESTQAQFLSGAVSKELEELRAPLATSTMESGTKQVTLQAPVDYSKVDYKWGMAVDLNRCTGCAACITACQAENNIPVVGRENVQRNRELFWMRIDRYFGGDLHDPRVITQPVACQQCETAPCEYVCPVNATVHSEEGLNDMVYNRCIGTRYCSNNCPYKVRRFNYFNYTGQLTATERLAQNPDVTVRARGVMEKCTFCIQRIEKGRIETRREQRKLKDGDVKTACQQACPTSAIAFGNLNDPNSAVTKAHEDGRAYNLLQQLGTRPRNRYLARIRNPNPKLTAAAPAHGEAHEGSHH